MSVQHVTAIDGKQQVRQHADKAAARLDECKGRSRSDVEAFICSLHVQQNFPDEPVVAVLVKQRIVCGNSASVTRCLDDQGTERGFIEPEMQQCIIDRPDDSKWPETDAQFFHFLNITRCLTIRPMDVKRCVPPVAIERYRDERVTDLVLFFASLEMIKLNAGFSLRAIRKSSKLEGLFGNAFFEL